MNHDEATIISTCAQYIDDTVNSGTINFKTGEAYSRRSTAHIAFTLLNASDVEDRNVWLPFHFLPGNDTKGSDPNPYFNRLVCRPNSEVAKAMCLNCIERKARPFSLHQLGITAHVFVDTWAHQGFAGIPNPVNYAEDIELAKGQTLGFNHRLFETFRREGFRTGMSVLLNLIQPIFVKWIAPVGHGMVLHYPDHPFRSWGYRNGHGEYIWRDNTAFFIEAADKLCEFIQRFRMGDPDAAVSGLPVAEKALIEDMLRTQSHDDANLRLTVWKKAISDGKFSFGPAELVYELEGEKSWKYEALGVKGQKISSFDKFDFSDSFLKSNWKHFHDAAQAHQHEILHEVLPKFGICAI